MRPLLVAALACFALLSGCADSSTSPSTDSAAPLTYASAGAPPTLDGSFDFGWVAAVGVPTTGQDLQVETTNAAEIDVPAGATRLDVNASWACLAPPCTLHIDLYAPDAQPTGPLDAGTPAAHSVADGMASLSVSAPAAGTWLVTAHADSLATMAQGSFDYHIEMATDDAIDTMAMNHTRAASP